MADSGIEGRGDQENNKGNGLLLYCYNYSYYSQKVIMALHEKKVSFSTREVQITKGEQYEPWYLQINPKGEVPVLQDGVRVIPDSSRIIDYLEDNFSNGNKPRLVPKDQGHEVRQKVDQFRNILDQLPAGVITMGSFYHPELCGERRFPFNFPISVLIKRMNVNSPAALSQLAERNPQFAESLMQKVKLQEQKKSLVEDKEQFERVLKQVDDALAQVENELATHQEDPDHSEWWLCCESFTVADISLCVLLVRLRNIGLSSHLWGDDKKPHLKKYLERVEKRESFVKTLVTPPFCACTFIKTYLTDCCAQLTDSCPMVVIAGGVAVLFALTAGYLLVRRK